MFDKYRNIQFSFVLTILGIALYGLLQPFQQITVGEQMDKRTLEVVMPHWVQTYLAAGDKFLAANIGILNVYTLSPFLDDSQTIHVQSLVQQEVSRLNPWNEDNYYIATAILPWAGYVDRTQFILEQTTEHRYWDMMPPFFQGFNEFYFRKNNQKAAELALLASDRTEGGVNKKAFKAIAAKWSVLGEDPEVALNFLKGLYQGSSDERMRNTVGARIHQLKGLLLLRNAAKQYEQEFGQKLSSLEELVNKDLIKAIPKDPIGRGYVLENNVPTIKQSKRIK